MNADSNFDHLNSGPLRTAIIDLSDQIRFWSNYAQKTGTPGILKVIKKLVEKRQEKWAELSEFDESKYFDADSAPLENFAKDVDSKIQRSCKNHQRKNWVYRKKDARSPSQKSIVKTQRAKKRLAHNRQNERDMFKTGPVEYRAVDWDADVIAEQALFD